MACDNTIDLNRAEQAVSSLPTDERHDGYESRTLQLHDRTRSVYLPLYPTVSFGPNNQLLLANVPVTRLAPQEIARRQFGAYTSDALRLMNNYDYSSSDFRLSRSDAEALSTRLQVGMSIITFNADRLRGICAHLLALHESFRRHTLRRRDVALKQPTLNSQQMAMALEFYLQIDVDLFYMKTCSFRGADPALLRFNTDGLFCGEEEPESRYRLDPCGSVSCPLCHPLNQSQKSDPWPVIDFDSSSMHRFVNGYTTFLNCPATCHTSNIIYTMTCPCGHYDYVDSSARTLADAMAYHREHGNRIIHEKLTGTRLFRGMTLDPNEQDKQIANQMRLYLHSARCPVALRSFLDCNPIYWCFIPMRWDEAVTENIVHFRTGTNSSLPFNVDPETVSAIALGAINDQSVARYLEHLPIPPAVYAFSYRQRQEQRLFLEQFLPSPAQQLPYSLLDLYKVTIIAVLPQDRSVILRYIIETLFIIHGDTKLNMICPLGGGAEQRYGRAYDLVWCANLNNPSSRASTTATQ